MKFSAFLIGLFLLLIACSAVAQSQDTVSVTAENFSELEQAIIDANARSPDTLTSIAILGTISVREPVPGTIPASDGPFFTVSSNIHINGGTLTQGLDAPVLLFLIDTAGSLQLNGTQFVDWSHAGFGPVLFENRGELHLEDAVLKSVVGHPAHHGLGMCPPNRTPIIWNTSSGTLRLEKVWISDSGTRVPGGVCFESDPMSGILRNDGTAELVETQIYLSDTRWKAPFFNAGLMRWQNASLFVRNDPENPSLDLLTSADTGHIESVNSVFEGFTGDWCERVDSLGHNTTNLNECSWISPGDMVGTPTGLIWQDSENGAVFDLVPSAASSIIDSADSDWCPDGRTVVDGDGDGIAVCDRGAIEYVPRNLSEGGANGLYYDPTHNGHYVYVLETDFTTVVMWNTFDIDGNQAWVLALGQLADGRSMIADAYLNENGVLTPDGPVDIERDRFWGTIQMELDSCAGGRMFFTSELPNFTSGQFELKRLAFVKQVGCQD